MRRQKPGLHTLYIIKEARTHYPALNHTDSIRTPHFRRVNPRLKRALLHPNTLLLLLLVFHLLSLILHKTFSQTNQTNTLVSSPILSHTFPLSFPTIILELKHSSGYPQLVKKKTYSESVLIAPLTPRRPNPKILIKQTNDLTRHPHHFIPKITNKVLSINMTLLLPQFPDQFP